MVRSVLTRALGVAAVACLPALAGCGGATPPPAAPKAAASAPVAKEPEPASLPPGHLSRDVVDKVLGQGPPWILRRVLMEEVIRGDKFVGWRMLKLPDEWHGVDLKAGDVVTRVNGMPVERPDEFFSAWSSLAVASDLRVAYERDGAARELTYHIDGQPAASPPAALREDAPPPPRPRPSGPPHKTVVIVGDDPPLGEGE